MEIRVLEYFLTVAREQNISKAAQALHLTQPTLSRQLKELENELGKELFIRGSRKITLTDDGMLLRKRAEEISSLVNKTTREITQSGSQIAGDIYIGAGETDGIRIFAKTANEIRKKYPLVHFHIVSGDKETVTDELDKGLLDFGLLMGAFDTSKYNFFELPIKDDWGVIMRKDSPLASKEKITTADIIDKPLIVSRQLYKSDNLSSLLNCDESQLNTVVTYNLMFNGSLMVEEGVGYAIGIDKIIDVSENRNLCFKPLYPPKKLAMSIVWKKYAVFSKAVEVYLKQLQKTIENSYN